MNCPNAYKKNGVYFILCKKEDEPDAKSRGTELYHSVCPYQMFCPNTHCYQLKDTFIQCRKLTEEAPMQSEATETAIDTPKTKMRSKGK